MALAPGTRLGAYEIQSLIGSGGLGEVYRARDTRLDRTVAIKQLALPHRGRFEQEARAIAALNHPHICQIYDIGADYLVLEYIDGSALTGPFPTERAIQLAIQIARGSADFLKKDLVAAVSGVKDEQVRVAFQEANRKAATALNDYAAWLEREKLPKASLDFALG